MPVVQDIDMLQLNHPELYNVWKGPFYINKHLVCDIELKSAYTCSIPSQLPKTLEIKKVVRLSELRKALPRGVFEKVDFSGQEVFCERVYYSLYPVTASNVRRFELAKLLDWLRDEDLALIKIINDQGFLVLVTPSALQFNKDPNRKDSCRLYALFLFPHSRLLDRKERENCSISNEDLSLKVTSLLPGLHYAILEAKRMQKDKDFKPNTVVELHVKQYARLQRKHVSVGEIKASDVLGQPPDHEECSPEKCDPFALSCLQTYLTSPVNFSLPLLKMSTLLKEDIPKSSDSEVFSKNVIVKDSVTLDTLLAPGTNKSGSSSGKSVLHENRKQPSKKRTFKKSGRRGSKKSKRKYAQQPSGEKSESPASSKKLKLQDEAQQQVVAPSRLTVKLASAPYPHGRKRGAEVLTAEFVNDNKISLTETVSDKRDKPQSTIIADKVVTRKLREKSPMKDLFLRPDRPPKRKASEPAYRNKSPETKTFSENMNRPMTRQKEQAERQKEQAEWPVNKTMAAIKSFEPAPSFRRPSTDLNSGSKQSPHPAPIPETNIMEKRINMYESHALNLLADLALNSFCSSSIPYITSESVAPKSEPLVNEKVHEGDSANAVEYPQNDCNLPVQSSTASQEPSQAPDCTNIPVKDVNDSSPLHATVATTPQQRTENGEKQTSYKVLIAAAKARARNNTTSKISLEHSYSQLPKEDVPDKLSKEESDESVQRFTESTEKSPATVMVVEQSPVHPFSGEVLVQSCDDADPVMSKEPRAVSKLQDKFLITFSWDTNYDFDLDSKFTNDPLEKTINRALHGPWNPFLKEKVEDVKIILHMWLALFYNKPTQPVPSSSRKVVEHSNPAKYVSINTVLDPCFEIVESDDQLNSPDAEKDSDPLVNEASVQQQVEKSNRNNLPIDLSLSSSKQKKDYNIKLSSEIFQMYNRSSLSALYSDSLQTTVMCKMMPASKMSTPPTNYMTTGSIPAVCSIGDRKQVNAELTTKTDKGVDIGASSSGKVGYGESEHKYSKGFFDVKAQKASSTALYENKDRSGRSNMSVTSENNLANTSASPLHDVNDNRATVQTESAVSQKRPSANKNAEVSPSNALNLDSRSADFFHQKYKLSRLSNTTKEHIPKNKSDLVSWMQQKNVHACSERDETIIQTAKTRIVLKPKIQQKNIDAAVGKRDSVDQNKNIKERETSNFHLVLTDGNRNELVISERSSHLPNDFKSSGFVESQAQSGGENLSHSAKEKAPVSDGERSSKQENGKDHVTGYRVLQKEIESCTDNELHGIKDTNAFIYLGLKNNNIKEAKEHSSTHKEILGKWSEESPEEFEDTNEEKEHAAVVKNVAHEMVASESMSKLELSPSSDETSDVDHTGADDAPGYLQPVEKVNVSTAGTELLQNMDRKALPDLADSSLEQHVALVHANDWSVPEEICDINKSSLTEPVLKQNSETNKTEEQEEEVVDAHITNAADITVNTAEGLSALSADAQLKGTEIMNEHLAHSDSTVENDLCNGDAPCDDKQAGFSHEAGHLTTAEKPGERTEMCLGGNLSPSDSPKFSDLGETTTSLFERLNSEAMKDSSAVYSPILESPSPVHDKGAFPAEKENASLLECAVEQTDLGSPGVDALTNDLETGNSFETVPHSGALQLREEAPEVHLDGELEAGKRPESGPVETHAEQLPVESQSDYTSVAVNVMQSPNQLEKSPKDRANRIQNAIRKEFFFKLKRICLSSGASQHTSSNSEDGVYIVHEEPGKGIAEEQKKTAGFELNTESSSKTEEDKTDEVILLEENLMHGIPVFAASLTDVEPETLLELDQMTSQSECLSPADHDSMMVQDKCLSPVSVASGNVQQNTFEDKWPTPPNVDLIDKVQGPIEDRPDVGLTDNMARGSPSQQDLVPSNADLIDADQRPIEDQCLAPPNVSFTDAIAQSPVGEKSFVLPDVDLHDNLELVPVQDKCLAPPNVDSTVNLIDHNSQDPVLGKKILPPNNNLIDRLEQDHFTEIQEQDSAQNKCLNPPNNCLIENIEMDPVLDKELTLNDNLTKDIEQNLAQEISVPPLNVDINNIGQVNLHNKCPSPPPIEFTDGLTLNPVLDKRLSPSHDEFADSMEQEDQSEICCIVSTGSISKEQYDRWSATSDEDIEVIQAYKETLSDKTVSDFQEECRSLLNAQAPQLTMYPKPSWSSKTKLLKRHSGPNTSLWEMDEYDPRYHRDYPSPKSHRNVIVSKKVAGKTVHRERPCAGVSSLDSLFANRRMASDDLTQNTLETEQLRFMCRLKDILRKSSTDLHVSEPPFQTMFESKKIPSSSGSGAKCKGPLIITVHCPRRRDYRGHDGCHPSSSHDQAYYDHGPWDRPTYYSVRPKNIRAHRYSPYHFNRLRYENTLEKPSSDISVILNECVQSNHIQLRRVSLGNTAVERTSTCLEPEEIRWQTRQTFEPCSSKSHAVGNIISDLCTNLHSKLHSVAKKTAKQNLYFYLCKTGDGRDDDDDDFFSSTKSLLIKDGHTPIEPQDFCDRDQAESNKLFVIIKNENVSSDIHKIPCLLQLKLHPDVTFAGVDTPEDVTESMYQELFPSGGFVVSEKSLLENITIGNLKDILMVLERMNGTSAWKWLLHYGENRKLKEDKRTESVSQSKIAMLKSYHHSNIIEILPYHQCDSRSKEAYSDLECLLSLQSQHIHSRLAVYLTATPCPEATDFEQNGILAYDVDTFIRGIQKVDAQLQSSSWR